MQLAYNEASMQVHGEHKFVEDRKAQKKVGKGLHTDEWRAALGARACRVNKVHRKFLVRDRQVRDQSNALVMTYKVVTVTVLKIFFHIIVFIFRFFAGADSLEGGMSSE
jgi:hypothetical protein